MVVASPTYITTGKRLRYAREHHDISQKELAQRIAQLLLAAGEETESDRAFEMASQIMNILLNPDNSIGARVEQFRVEKGWSQDRLAQEMDEVLSLIKLQAPPGKAGISKIERGARSLDYYEAMALSICLERLPWHFLPEEMAAKVSEMVDRISPDPLQHWRQCRSRENGKIRQFQHPHKKGVITMFGNPSREAIKLSCSAI